LTVEFRSVELAVEFTSVEFVALIKVELLKEELLVVFNTVVLSITVEFSVVLSVTFKELEFVKLLAVLFAVVFEVEFVVVFAAAALAHPL
jgi:hypothetical protein